MQPSCMLCGAHPHQQNNLCAPCIIDIPWSKNPCSRCAEYIESIRLDGQLLCTNCLKQPPPYSRTVCAFDYLGPISGLMNQFKHQHNLAAGRLLTACLNQTICKTIAQGQTIMPQLLIPVPLHRRRLRQRGFNQAQFIATGLGQSLNLSVNAQLCHRSRHQAPQQGQSRRHRLAQMSGVFQINKTAADHSITSIAIIDDVMTTGATAQALSRSLINAWDGPLDIQVWCVARAQPPNVRIEW
jgi:ComF family protein